MLSTIKERPILFKADMVRAIFALVKDQTRRTNGLDFINENPGCWQMQWVPAKDGKHWLFTCGDDRVQIRCPYGVEGERLWVRETFSYNLDNSIVYRADSPSEAHEIAAALVGWKPSIFMPRAVSRLLLEITSVRCERLNDISEADAVKEGVAVVESFKGHPHYENYLDDWAFEYTAKDSYATLWEKINGLGSWSDNPWVWVVDFKLIKGGKEVKQ